MTRSKKAVALKAPKAATKVEKSKSNFFSIATGKPVTAWYARHRPDKVVEGVNKLPKGAVVVDAVAVIGKDVIAVNPSLAKKKPAKKTKKKVAKKAVKKTRLVKRVKSGKKGGTFAKKTSTGGNVRTDFIDAIPTPRKRVTVDLGKTSATKAAATVEKVKKETMGMSAAAAKRSPKKKAAK